MLCSALCSEGRPGIRRSASRLDSKSIRYLRETRRGAGLSSHLGLPFETFWQGQHENRRSAGLQSSASTADSLRLLSFSLLCSSSILCCSARRSAAHGITEAAGASRKRRRSRSCPEWSRSPASPRRLGVVCCSAPCSARRRRPDGRLSPARRAQERRRSEQSCSRGLGSRLLAGALLAEALAAEAEAAPFAMSQGHFFARLRISGVASTSP